MKESSTIIQRSRKPHAPKEAVHEGNKRHTGKIIIFRPGISKKLQDELTDLWALPWEPLSEDTKPKRPPSTRTWPRRDHSKMVL